MSKRNNVSNNVVMNAEVVDRVYTDVELSVLKNAALAKSVKAYAGEVGRAKKSMWKMASILANVVSTETYKDDFATDKEFAKFMGISPAALSKMVRVVAIKVGDAGLEDLGYSRIVAEEMLPLVKKGLIEDFFNSEDHPDPNMSREDMRASVKAFIEMRDSDGGHEEKQADCVFNGDNPEPETKHGLESFDDTDTDEYVYTVPIFNVDAVEEWTIKLKGYDAMERFAKAVRTAYNVEEKKGTVEDLT